MKGGSETVARMIANALSPQGVRARLSVFCYHQVLDRKDRPIKPKWLELLSLDVFRRRCDRLQAKAARWSRWLGWLGIARRTRLRAEAVRRGIAPEEVDMTNIRGLFFVDAAYLGAAHDEISKLYGSPDSFVAEGLGWSRAELARLRADLLE